MVETREVNVVKSAIGLLALVLSSSAVAQTPYRYEADTLDINQGVYICERADAQTLNRLNAEPDAIKRRNVVAPRLGCRFHIAGQQAEYVAEEYPVARQIAGVCYRGAEGFCEQQAFAVLLYMQGQPKAVVSLWLDEDRD